MYFVWRVWLQCDVPLTFWIFLIRGLLREGVDTQNNIESIIILTFINITLAHKGDQWLTINLTQIHTSPHVGCWCWAAWCFFVLFFWRICLFVVKSNTNSLKRKFHLNSFLFIKHFLFFSFLFYPLDGGVFKKHYMHEKNKVFNVAYVIVLIIDLINLLMCFFTYVQQGYHRW